MSVFSANISVLRKQAAIVLFLILGIWVSVFAQEQLPRPRPSTIPPVPLLEPRPFEGEAADQRFQARRAGEDREPVAAFLKSLQSSDATIEVTLGQGRLVTTKKPIVNEKGNAVIAVGDPTILDFEVLPNPRMIRLIGKRPGVTDLSITTADDQAHVFEVHVVLDVALINAQLRQMFPSAEVKLSQFRGHVLIEGQARNISQITAIDKLVRASIASLEANSGQGGVATLGPPAPAPAEEQAAQTPMTNGLSQRAEVEPGQRGGLIGAAATTQVINLMKVPGVQQVLLQVKIGELNRTGLREMGADWFIKWAQHENTIGTRLTGSSPPLTQTVVRHHRTGKCKYRFWHFPFRRCDGGASRFARELRT